VVLNLFEFTTIVSGFTGKSQAPPGATVCFWLVYFDILGGRGLVEYIPTIKQIAVFPSDWCGKIEHLYTLYNSVDAAKSTPQNNTYVYTIYIVF